MSDFELMDFPLREWIVTSTRNEQEVTTKITASDLRVFDDGTLIFIYNGETLHAIRDYIEVICTGTVDMGGVSK